MKILVVEDDQRWQELYKEMLEDGAYHHDIVGTISDALQRLSNSQNADGYDVVCMNYEIGNPGNGRALLRELRNKYESIPVILVTGHFDGDLERSVKAIDNLKNRYKNLKEVLVKGGGEEPSPVFCDTFYDYLERLLDQKKQCILPSESNTITWIHLSDLHFGHSNNTANYLHKALIEDVKAHQLPTNEQDDYLARVQLIPDYLFITGDIAYHADEAEYEEASNLITEIWQETQIGKGQTFIIPGNHDVLRSAVAGDPVYQMVYKELIEDSLSEEDWFNAFLKWWKYPHVRELWQKKFLPYFKFTQRHMTLSCNLCHYAYSIDHPKGKIEIVGLNSALMSWKNQEDRERGLCIGKQQWEAVEAEMSDDADLRVALIHHPPDALHTHDTSWKHMEEKCDVILHGHIHKPEVQPSTHSERPHIRIVGGSINQDGAWRPQRYSYCVYNFETKELDIYMRKTNASDSPYYIRDNETSGRSAPNGHLRYDMKTYTPIREI